MMTPLAVFGLGMLIGGSLSVVFYRRRNPVANITPWVGFRLGMASGVTGGGIFALLLAAGTVVELIAKRLAEPLGAEIN